jgi:hypothetical protein
MKRILVSCLAIAGGIGVLLAASPEVDRAIRTLKSVSADAGKLELFCWFLREEEKVMFDRTMSSEVRTKRLQELEAKVPPDIAHVLLTADGVDGTTRDGREFYAVYRAVKRKCR